MEQPTPQINKKKNFFSEWLEQLQQESWQLELLISGLALFGIWESRGMIRKITYYLDVNDVSDYSFYSKALVLLLWSGWAIFLVNLLIHIIIRGLWIGAIGLRYVSGDIDFDQLNYSDVFRNYLQKRIGSFDDYIERLEKLSSVLFSFTFLLFFMFLSFVMVNVVFGIVMQIVDAIFDEDGQMFMGFFGIAFYGIGILVLIDFISLGAFKKVKDKTFATIYLWIYRFYSTVSLSFIYRPLLLNFIDDKYTRKLFFLAIPYVLFILVGFKGLEIEGHSYMPTFSTNYDYHNIVSREAVNWIYYDDLRSDHGQTFNNGNEIEQKFNIQRFSLSNYKVDGNLLEFFVEYRDSDNNDLQSEGLTAFRERGIKHTMFAKGNVDNPELERLDSLYLIEFRLQRDIIREDVDVDTLDYPDIVEHIRYWKTKDDADLNQVRIELRKRYETLREQSFKKQLKDIKSALLSQYAYQIDGTTVEILSSKFYTHPNMHERGLLCYISIEDLDVGLHEFVFSWSEGQRSGGDVITVIPFLKN